MREILFRGKRKDNGEWVQGDFVHPCNIVFEELGYDEVLKRNNVPIWNDHEVIPETVGQFIGLTDVHDRKIFEGDKVKLVDSEDDSIYSVEHHAEKTQYILRKRKVFESDDIIIDTNICIFLHCFTSAELEVVGNVADDGGAV